MQITDFDYDTIDRQLQADYTSDFLTAMFAHEGVDDALMWGAGKMLIGVPTPRCSIAIGRSDPMAKPI